MAALVAPARGAPGQDHGRCVYPRRKRAFDLVGAGFALVLVLPLLAVIAGVSRIVDGPGVVFRQRRVGLGGEEFMLLKFRSLAPANPDESATRWSVRDDERMSAWGRFLRRASLDELPQLLNVLRGQMSLVGPRPERPHFVKRFSALHPTYASRHRMPGGITGLAQVSGLRGDTSISERAKLDNHYIDTWSLRSDLIILLRTPLALFHGGE